MEFMCTIVPDKVHTIPGLNHGPKFLFKEEMKWQLSLLHLQELPKMINNCLVQFLHISWASFSSYLDLFDWYVLIIVNYCKIMYILGTIKQNLLKLCNYKYISTL